MFLRDWRLTLVASITLPLAVMMTFLVMHLFGETINLMSMGGLAVAIGLVIDDAVVVVEGIHRRVQDGVPAPVEDALNDLTAPIVSSTLTTVVVFAPLGLLSGVVGQFFRSLVADALGSGPRVARPRADADPAPVAVGGPRVARGGDAPARPPRRRVCANSAARTGAPMAGGTRRARARRRGGRVAIFSVGTGFLPRADEGGFVVDYLTPPARRSRKPIAS